MITLTTPPKVTAKLGSTLAGDQVSYDKMVLAPLTLDRVAQTISGNVRLTSTAAPTMQAIIGSLSISVPTSTLTIEVRQLDFYRQITLDSGQNTTVLSIISAAQNSVEQGLIDLGLIAGTQSAGA